MLGQLANFGSALWILPYTCRPVRHTPAAAPRDRAHRSTGAGELERLGGELRSWPCPGTVKHSLAFLIHVVNQFCMGVFVWARRALNRQKRRFRARAVKVFGWATAGRPVAEHFKP
jgi:hypothetical protein